MSTINGSIESVGVNGMVRIGRKRLAASEIKKIHSGDVVNLQTKVSEPVKLFFDSKEVAKVKIEEADGMFWVKVVEIL